MGRGWLCKPVLGCGERVAEQLGELITVLLVEGAVKEKVRNIFGGGIAVGALGGGAGNYRKVSSGGTVAKSRALGAVPGLVIRRGSVKGRIKAVAVPRRVAAATKQDGVGFIAGVDVAVSTGFIAEALLLSSAAVAGSVGGKPVCAAAKTRHGATMRVGDGVVAKVRLWGE